MTMRAIRRQQPEEQTRTPRRGSGGGRLRAYATAWRLHAKSPDLRAGVQLGDWSLQTRSPVRRATAGVGDKLLPRERSEPLSWRACTY